MHIFLLTACCRFRFPCLLGFGIGHLDNPAVMQFCRHGNRAVPQPRRISQQLGNNRLGFGLVHALPLAPFSVCSTTHLSSTSRLNITLCRILVLGMSSLSSVVRQTPKNAAAFFLLKISMFSVLAFILQNIRLRGYEKQVYICTFAQKKSPRFAGGLILVNARFRPPPVSGIPCIQAKVPAVGRFAAAQ